MATLYVVGIGPGSEGGMTLEARAALKRADVLCGYGVYLDLVAPLFPEKERFSTPMRGELERCRRALALAQEGRCVALVCSGDAGVYGMASPILELLPAYPGAEVEIVPGVTAALSGAALLGLSSGFCAGAAYAFLHKLGKEGVDSAFIILFFSIFSCVACVPFLVCGFCPMTGLQLLMLIGAGAGAALGQFGITWAYRFAEPRQIVVYDYTCILFTAALGFLAFGQIPDLLSVLGFAVIIGMAIVLHRR